MNDSDHCAPRLSRESGRAIFGVDAAGYDAARPGYPAELYAAIADHAAGAPLAAIGEIGAGTGLATTALLDFAPDRYVAFEPDVALAAYLRDRFAGITVVAEDFCAAPVTGGFDLIAAASCFHWLDPEPALAKARALLRPGGTLAIWWNVYREPGIGDPFAEAVLPLLAGLALPPSEAAGGHYSRDTALHEGRLVAAGFAGVAYHLFRRTRILSAAQARALYASFSFVRFLPDGRRTGLLDAIGEIVETRFGGAAPSVVLSPLYLARVPSG